LSVRGKKYAENLAKELSAHSPKPKLVSDCSCLSLRRVYFELSFQIWTSELRRTINTVQNIPGARAALKDLNEINAGICEGLTYEEIQERFPSEFAWRDQDKLKYRYPHGESYLDLLQRVDGVVQALLLNTAVLVVSHQAVLRCIMAYFKGSRPGKCQFTFCS
jgi:6-phosphofructo-2-kinase / fructose-2,6-biphosphatase 3